MNISSRLLVILLILTLLVPGAFTRAQDGTFPRTITDGAGNKVTLNAKPVRIVSVALVADEMLLALVDPSRLIAVTANSLDPAQSNIADIAVPIPNKLTTADPEKVIALKPDLIVLSPFTDAGVIKQLKDAGAPVFLLGGLTSIKEIEDSIVLLGQAVGEEKKAASIVSAMEEKLKSVEDAVKGIDKPLTVVYYGPDGYSVGGGSTIDEVIRRAGGVNAVVAGGVKDMFPQLSDEFMVTQDPDVVLLAGFNSYSPGFVDKFNKNPNFQTLKAIKNKRVVVANDAHVATVSQYIVEGVADVAAILYPDRYKPAPAATASATMSATVAATAAR